MTNIAPEQRAQIKQRAIEFGFPKDIAFRISMNVTNSYARELVSTSPASDFLTCAFSWESSSEGYKFWEKIYLEAKERELFEPTVSETHQGLTQGEVQQLLHVLRGELCCTLSHKYNCRSEASELWKGANKDEKESQNCFEEFSFYHSLAKKAKQQESKLVNLITKLKGMR